MIEAIHISVIFFPSSFDMQLLLFYLNKEQNEQ